MITYTRTNSGNKDFKQLAAKLDDELKIRDGEEHAFYAQLNKIDNIKYAVVAYENELPIGCGAIREFSDNTMELKRMFVLLNKRQHGIASAILKILEQWIIELKFEKCILETGKNQPEAIAFYQKHHYTTIPNYGKYVNAANSISFIKNLAG